MASAVSSGFRPPGPPPSGASAATSLTMPVNSAGGQQSSAQGGIGGQSLVMNPGSTAATSSISAVASNSAISGTNIGANLSMAGLLSSNVTSNFKPVPMKLFATWEVDRTPPNCIPR